MDKNELVIHNIKFYKPAVRAIHCMSYRSNNEKLALSRSDNSIEIWDVKYSPHLQKLIINNSNCSIEDVKWCGSRLFSCGLYGDINEYDLTTCTVKHTTAVTGGAAWCLDISPDKQLIACGTEEGYINIFAVLEDNINFEKLLDKQEGRILCISWDKSGTFLVTGSIDTIRVWNLETGHAVHRITTGRSESKKETIVWCLTVISDFVIISGDSRGQLCFWDGKTGVFIERFNSHRADILALTIKEDESTVFCSGVDPLIAMYGKVNAKVGSSRTWAKSGQRNIYDHDVRALAVTRNNVLISGGVDGCLAFSSYPPKVLIQCPPLLSNICTTAVKKDKFVLLRYMTHVQLWKLGNATTSTDGSEDLAFIAEIKPKEGEKIICSAVSSSGEIIAYSTQVSLKFFKCNLEDQTLCKMPDLQDCGPCSHIVFFEDNCKDFCIVATKNREINIVEIDKTGPDIVNTIRLSKVGSIKSSVAYVVLSKDTQFLLVADWEGHICVWRRNGWSIHCKLPKYKISPTAINIHPTTNNIVIVYSNRRIVEYSLKTKSFTQFSSSVENCLPVQWMKRNTVISNIIFDPKREEIIIMYDISMIWVLNKNMLLQRLDEVSSKMIKLEKGSVERDSPKNQQAFTTIKKYKHIASLHWLSEDQLAVVVVDPHKLKDNLPNIFFRKVYGF